MIREMVTRTAAVVKYQDHGGDAHDDLFLARLSLLVLQREPGSGRVRPDPEAAHDRDGAGPAAGQPARSPRAGIPRGRLHAVFPRLIEQKRLIGASGART